MVEPLGKAIWSVLVSWIEADEPPVPERRRLRSRRCAGTVTLAGHVPVPSQPFLPSLCGISSAFSVPEAPVVAFHVSAQTHPQASSSGVVRVRHVMHIPDLHHLAHLTGGAWARPGPRCQCNASLYVARPRDAICRCRGRSRCSWVRALPLGGSGRGRQEPFPTIVLWGWYGNLTPLMIIWCDDRALVMFRAAPASRDGHSRQRTVVDGTADVRIPSAFAYGA